MCVCARTYCVCVLQEVCYQVVGPRGLESSQFNCWDRRIGLASSSVTSPSPTARCGYTHHALLMLLYSHCTHIHTLCVQSRETLNVSQFHITNWAPDGSCSNIKTVTDVIDEIIKVQIRTGNKPITVHCRFILVLLTVVLTDHVCVCSDTVSRSGMFCAIATTIERIKIEGVVDVFQVVKALRVHKPGAVCTLVSIITTHLFHFVLLCSGSTKLFLMQFWCL